MEAQPGGGCEMETREQLWWFSAPTVFCSQHKRIMEISASKMVLQHLPVGNDLVPSKQTLDFSVSSFG
jgi:hypothetical protein